MPPPKVLLLLLLLSLLLLLLLLFQKRLISKAMAARHALRVLAVPCRSVLPTSLRRFAAAANTGLSATANSYISLGKFETMGADVGRMATGIAYLQDTLQMLEAEYNAEENLQRKAIRGLGLAKNLLE
ncbi:unnamed protein product, partial [Polarella glacialis]